MDEAWLVELRAPAALGPGLPDPTYGRLGFRDRCTVARYRYPTGV
jgi:hypothetical protein